MFICLWFKRWFHEPRKSLIDVGHAVGRQLLLTGRRSALVLIWGLYFRYWKSLSGLTLGTFLHGCLVQAADDYTRVSTRQTRVLCWSQETCFTSTSARTSPWNKQTSETSPPLLLLNFIAIWSQHCLFAGLQYDYIHYVAMWMACRWELLDVYRVFTFKHRALAERRGFRFI